jgi:hypothetical protein
MESIRSFSIFDFRLLIEALTIFDCRLPIDRKRVASGTAKETTEHNQQSKIENRQCFNRQSKIENPQCLNASMLQLAIENRQRPVRLEI